VGVELVQVLCELEVKLFNEIVVDRVGQYLVFYGGTCGELEAKQKVLQLVLVHLNHAYEGLERVPVVEIKYSH
jgi:hypothetical protein